MEIWKGDVVKRGQREVKGRAVLLKSQDFLGFALCSDGVWEFLDMHDAARILMSQREKANPHKVDPTMAAEALAAESWNRWMEDTGGEISDDITVVFQLLQ